jgi:hypothetical protein
MTSAEAHILKIFLEGRTFLNWVLGLVLNLPLAMSAAQ